MAARPRYAGMQPVPVPSDLQPDGHGETSSGFGPPASGGGGGSSAVTFGLTHPTPDSKLWGNGHVNTTGVGDTGTTTAGVSTTTAVAAAAAAELDELEPPTTMIGPGAGAGGTTTGGAAGAGQDSSAMFSANCAAKVASLSIEV